MNLKINKLLLAIRDRNVDMIAPLIKYTVNKVTMY
jgi:hypothetical protein